MSSQDRKPSSDCPVEDLEVLKKSPPSSAGGPAAVFSSIEHIHESVGLIKGTRLLMDLNQKKGFDCPGCAWPDPDEKRSQFEFCENGVKAVAEEATEKRIGADFFKKHSVQELSLKSDLWLGKQGRLTQPMILREGSHHYEAISYEQAYKEIAQALKDSRGPDHCVFYTSGRTSNEAAFLYQLMIRSFGTNNLPDCSNLCHESSGVALKESIGVGKGTVRLQDFPLADTILVVGQNPGTNHPRMLSTLQEAVRQGSKIITINPLDEAGLKAFRHPQEVQGWIGPATRLTHLHLPVKINGDIALFHGFAKHYLEHAKKEKDFLDHEFIKNQCEGFEEYQNFVDQLSWDEIIESSGLTRDQVWEASKILLDSKEVIACWAMGLTQHENAVGNIQSLVNLLLMRGQIGRPGSGVCPVRGHSNVQGDRTMGIWERPSESFLQSMDQEFSMSFPRKPGYCVVEAIDAMLESKVDVLICLGGNLLSASPDTDQTAVALRKVPFSVQISTKLNRSHLITGKTAIILPCLVRSERDIQEGGEQFITVENSMGIVHSSNGKLNPAHPDLASEVKIIASIAHELLGEKPVNFPELAKDYSRIRNHISRTIPGFENFNKRLQKENNFYLPNPVRDKRQFHCKNSKAQFHTHEIPENKLQEGEFLMMTIRTHDQYNTTIYGLKDRYRGFSGDRRIVLLNENEMRKLNLSEGDLVTLQSRFAERVRTARSFRAYSYKIPPRCCATYFPEANVLVPLEQRAKKSHTPASKSVVITIEKSS